MPGEAFYITSDRAIRSEGKDRSGLTEVSSEFLFRGAINRYGTRPSASCRTKEPLRHGNIIPAKAVYAIPWREMRRVAAGVGV